MLICCLHHVQGQMWQFKLVLLIVFLGLNQQQIDFLFACVSYVLAFEIIPLLPSNSITIVVCVQPADIYLIDEPSAYLDSEQRIVAAKVIKRFILHAKKTAFVVEHDFIMATYLADRVIVYEGEPSIDCVANTPQSLLTGMNLFLSVSLWNL